MQRICLATCSLQLLQPGGHQDSGKDKTQNVTQTKNSQETPKNNTPNVTLWPPSADRDGQGAKATEFPDPHFHNTLESNKKCFKCRRHGLQKTKGASPGALGEVPPRGALGDAPPRRAIWKVPPRRPLVEVPPRRALGEVPPRGLFWEVPPRSPLGEVSPRGPLGRCLPEWPWGRASPRGSLQMHHQPQCTG